MKSVVSIRLYSSNASMRNSANSIRKEFLDYFTKDLGHSFIRSSPVLPLNDDTVAFVNAGMNQFKGVFLNYHESPAKKVANSQKCIRVGGKHNDLSVVGHDTYHHTFFEMLGNWSFGDYFKEEACRYAWDLLTKRYGINKEFLYVTYFGGDTKLEMEPDLECKDIWSRIGVSQDKILPFGLQDNFWEMGPSGPCGPCTEIHVDHTKQLLNQSKRINKGYSDLTELWNIVFIQYERLTNGSIVPLSKHHVDTGMGLERLVTLLQEKKSNYDTDLFQPLFKAIQTYTKAPEYKGRFCKDESSSLDNGYRILADHSRMITVALADGTLPEEQQKLRRVMRKAIDVGEKVFKKNGILSELSYVVTENLGDVYPELQNNLKKVRKIIEYEEDLFKRLRHSSGKEWKKIVQTRPELASVTEWMTPGLVKGYKDLQLMLKDIKGTMVLPGNVAFKLYDTHGLSSETISELAEIESLRFDEAAFQYELNLLRHRSRMGKGRTNIVTRKCLESLEENHVPATDDSFKYQYNFNGRCYEFPEINSTVVGLIVNGNIILKKGQDIQELESWNDNEIGIVLDKTLCYSLEGGQVSDKGFICTKGLTFKIDTVRKMNNYVIHFGNFIKYDVKNTKEKLKIGDNCVVSVNPEVRTGAMMHHTGAHLLNASLKKFLQAVYQRSAAVLSDGLKLQFNSFSEKLTHDQMRVIEKLVNDVIESNVPVRTKMINALELLKEDCTTLVSGEIYPYTGIRLVEINSNCLSSREPCCGTHVHNTGVLQCFCFINYTSKGASNCTVKAIVGPLALAAKKMGENARRNIYDLENKLKSGKYSYEEFESMIDEMKRQITSEHGQMPIPYIIREDCLRELQTLSKTAWTQAKELEQFSITTEIKGAVDSGSPFIVHALSKNPAYLSLHEVASLFPTTPTLIISHNNEVVKARCCVPQDLASEEFNAKSWMDVILRTFNASYGPVKGFDPLLVSSMKSKIVSKASQDPLTHKALSEARNFASLYTERLKVSAKVKPAA